MNPMIMRFLVLAAMALATFSMQSRARAEGISDTDMLKVQTVIAAQLAALTADDADRAFETATPEVRQDVGSAERFLQLVRSTYPMVYRHSAANFLKPEVERGQVMQLVQLRDANEKTWLVLFALERQADDTWRIGSCLVAETRQQDV
ncbi:DUF4864 domain-containing protein [Ramlibacter sp.]|uniref:DUF4864 domain-containing protein n=1 Tax=Ramlibacter sp. TaxID=1917967 RepID=UPI003D0C64E9